jgi:acyl-CoA synthetase (AMP-forming)/AMP-acid ligase II
VHEPRALVGWVAAVARAQARRPAVHGDGVSWSYEELWGRAGGIARHLLRDRGVEPGDRVGLVGANEPAYLAAYFGVLRAGGVVVPLNAMLDVADMRDQLAHVDAVATIVGDVDAAVRDGLADALPAWYMNDLRTAATGVLPPTGPGDPACIFLTSGSTGRPKGVVHTQASLLHMALQLASTLPFGPEERSIAFLPFFAAAEQVLPVLCTGGSLDVLPGFDPERIAAAARHATSFDAVPTVMARLLDLAPHDDLAHLGWVSFASEPMPVGLLRRWWDALPAVATYQFYGMTELVPATVASDRLQREEPASVGVPFPTSRLSALDATGREGPEGELVCRSPAQMLGYHGDADATAAAMTADGAIRTGDLGRIDERGRVFLTGRLKDLIISGGLNVAPAEIEAVACEHPGVLTAVVVGIPDARWGETPVVVAVPARHNGVAARDVLHHCRRELASFKRPSAAALVDVLPATGIGKSAKAVIRQQILDGEIALVRAD